MNPAIWHVMLGLGFNPAGIGALAALAMVRVRRRS